MFPKQSSPLYLNARPRYVAEVYCPNAYPNLKETNSEIINRVSVFGAIFSLSDLHARSRHVAEASCLNACSNLKNITLKSSTTCSTAKWHTTSLACVVAFGILRDLDNFIGYGNNRKVVQI